MASFRYLATTTNSPNLRRLAICGYFGLISIATVSKMLHVEGIPPSAGSDLAFHLAYVQNFFAALKDGQWIPRLQLQPHLYPDIPTFQFYGFLMGLLTSPFLAIGRSPLSSVALGLAMVRWAGSMTLYAACRETGSSRIVAVIAATTFLISPYVLSNIYGRLAFPEAGAHMILCVLFYGLIRLRSRNDSIATLTTIVSVIALALAHPIFLLYGGAAAALFALVSMPLDRSFPALGILIGSILLAAFQWLPGMLLQSNFAAIFTPASPYADASFSSFSGMFGIPRSVADTFPRVDENYKRLFLTASIATIPVLLFLLFRIRDRIALAVLLCLGVSLILALPPFDLWALLPRLTWALQFPYRAFSLVALFVAMGIGLWRRHWMFPLGLGCAVAAQSFVILHQPFLTGQIDTVNLPEIYASVNYRLVTDLPLISSDRWLTNEHSFFVDAPRGSTLHIAGTSAWKDRTVRVWMAPSSAPQEPSTPKYSVGPGPFNLDIALPAAGEYQLVTSQAFVPARANPANPDTRKLSFTIEEAEIRDRQPLLPLLASSAVDRTYAHGYARTFKLKPDTVTIAGTRYRVELPLSFSPLMHISQDGLDLPVRNSINTLAVVETNNPTRPIQAHYRLPIGVWILMLLGFAVIFASLKFGKIAAPPNRFFYRPSLPRGRAKKTH